MKTYSQAVCYLERFIHYEKTPPARGGKKTFDLDGFRELLAHLGDPHKRFRVIHVAGTKGKGSTCAMLAGILQARGFKTGLYTSPHLISYRERMQINGKWISSKHFVRQIIRVQKAMQRSGSCPGQPAGFLRRMMPRLQGPIGRPPRPPAAGPAAAEFRTTFEILTAAAFLEFAEQSVDIAVIETGLGGRLDATNVVRPEAAVLTGISLDHTQILGKTLAKIARDKSGILKPGCMAVMAPQPREALRVLQKACARKKIRALWHGKDWRINNVRVNAKGTRWDLHVRGQVYKNLHCPLPGRYQAENGSLAVLAAASIGCSFSGLERVRWPGRFQIVGNTIYDGAHNEESARRLAETFREIFPRQRCVMVLGVSMDKDVREMLRHLGKIAPLIIATQAAIPRAMPAGRLASYAAPGQKILVEPNAHAALRLARRHAAKGQKVLVTGSLFLIGDLLPHAPRHIV